MCVCSVCVRVCVCDREGACVECACSVCVGVVVKVGGALGHGRTHVHRRTQTHACTDAHGAHARKQTDTAGAHVCADSHVTPAHVDACKHMHSHTQRTLPLNGTTAHRVHY